MQCLILAGGLGTRMRPITERIPKALIEVAGKPFVAHQLGLLARQGVRHVVFSIGYLGGLLQDYVGNGAPWGLDVTYVDEGEVLRGTAGAIRLAIDRGCLNPRFLVLYGDSYLPISLKHLWATSMQGALPTMTVLRNNNAWDRSNVRIEDSKAYYCKRVADPIAENMHYIDYGVSALSCDVIRSLVPSDSVIDLADVFHKLSLTGTLQACEIFERFYEIGSKTGLRDLEQYFKQNPLLLGGIEEPFF